MNDEGRGAIPAFAYRPRIAPEVGIYPPYMRAIPPERKPPEPVPQQDRSTLEYETEGRGNDVAIATRFGITR